jgi:hypothetical protein
MNSRFYLAMAMLFLTITALASLYGFMVWYSGSLPTPESRISFVISIVSGGIGLLAYLQARSARKGK